MALNNPKVFELDWNGKKITLETGRLAKQANGAVLVRMGDTVVLVTAVASTSPSPLPFLPLTINYQEQAYAAGKFPGGFFKREGRPGDHETLTCRLIDRPLRPLFPDGYNYETQIIATVVSHDGVHNSDVPAMVGASAALSISDIPWNGPIVGCRVGYIDGDYVLNPTVQQQEKSQLDALIVVSEDSVVMVEGGAEFLGEDVIVGALEFAKEQGRPLVELQKQMVAELGLEKFTVDPPEPADESLVAKVRDGFEDRLREAAKVPDKLARYKAYKQVKKAAVEALGEGPEGEDLSGDIGDILEDLKKEIVRGMIKSGVRVDGRDTSTVRPIEIETGWLPRTHGSALFTRGETQAMVATTLGSGDDEQKVDTLEREWYKRFYLHYNFPPYSVGEVKFLRSPGRREIGHGMLAERAIDPALPTYDDFPYTVRAVSDVTESNGSSSMATVCGASLSMMQAGVPLKGHVAGVAMGLIQEDGEFIILTDILGDEDHLGDMDFKVAGSREGITSFQMDIKVEGVTREVMANALEQARVARLHILDKMYEVQPEASKTISPHAPSLISVRIPSDKIGAVIGPGGKVIRALTAETGTKIDIEEDGLVKIFSPNQAGAAEAKKQIEALTKDVERGEYYVGTVRKIVDFGAFVEILPGTDGLVHISEIAEERINKVSDEISEGDRFPVVVLDVDPQGKIRLSRKKAFDKTIEEIEGGAA